MSVIEAERVETETPADMRELADTADARKRLRRQADRTELRLALADLAESLRGFVRSAPLTAVAAAAALGVVFSRRKRRQPARRRV
jgi:ElaB/YqjD/DUF883 family membrane-anchored ribosome-binding protein